MKAHLSTAAATVLAAMFITLVGCSDEAWGRRSEAAAPVADATQSAADVSAPQDPCHGVNCDDGNPCTDDSCKAGTCAHTPNAAICDDSDACTAGDKCSAGACKGAAVNCDDGNLCTIDKCLVVSAFPSCLNTPVSCDDGNPCTIDKCVASKGCVNTPGDAACDDSNPCTTDSCDAATGCTHKANMAACDDSDACTAGDKCKAGVCAAGSKADCDDGNLCTDDSCDAATGCTHKANMAACDDSNQYTVGDKCKAGVCAGTKVECISTKDCDDANLCTDDGCDGKTGTCAHMPNAAICDDSDACTAGDKCKAGVCAAGSKADCDDGNLCTDDSCDAVTGCTHKANTAACDDSNPYTIGDKCKAGVCAGTKVECISTKDCDDANPCTKDECDAAGGCSHKAVVTVPPLVCDDGNVCTTDDKCWAGKCIPGPAAACDDSNPCTTDSCDPKSGCTHTPNVAPCDDGNVCTTSDQCKAGVCVGGPAPVCNDKNPCTEDSCDPKSGCTHTLNVAPCDDGNPYTLGDKCSGGACVAVSKVECVSTKDCDDGDACTGDSCKVGSCVHVVIVCPDDDNPCTKDICVNNVCTYLPANNGQSCNDGNVGTQGDVCGGGTCKGAAINCDDGNPCTDDAVDPKSGCTHTPNVAPCDDGNPCTQGDKCASGKCMSGPSTCECQTSSDCASLEDGNACNGTLVCDLKSHKCVVDLKTVVMCSAAQDTSCAKNACDPASGKCVLVPANAGTGCTDSDACTAGDVCSAGKCSGTPVSCDDGNPCTKDECDKDKGCVHTANTAACNDGNALTDGDKCSFGVCAGMLVKVDCQKDNDCDDGVFCNGAELCKLGKCVASPKVSCDDGIACTKDVCLETSGGWCNHPADDFACGGGLKCEPASSWDVLTATPSGCVVCKSNKDCNDGNPCTEDTCDTYGSWACNHTPKQLIACDDGNPCTEGDACGSKDGKCHGTPDLCDDSNPCTVDACDPVKGCVHTPYTGGGLMTCGIGYCVNSVTFCVAGVKQSCAPKTPASSETCGNGVDDNCNGKVDDGCSTPQPPPVLFVVETSSPAAAEVWYFHAPAYTGGPETTYGQNTASTPFTVSLNQAQACMWGIEVAARVPSGTWGWYGCDASTPSLSTLTIKVNGVVKTGVLTKHPWACGGGGEGNLFFSPSLLGCPK